METSDKHRFVMLIGEPAAGKTTIASMLAIFGRSDTRAAQRAFFHVDAASIVKAALQQLN